VYYIAYYIRHRVVLHRTPFVVVVVVVVFVVPFYFPSMRFMSAASFSALVFFFRLFAFAPRVAVVVSLLPLPLPLPPPTTLTEIGMAAAAAACPFWVLLLLEEDGCRSSGRMYHPGDVDVGVLLLLMFFQPTYILAVGTRFDSVSVLFGSNTVRGGVWYNSSIGGLLVVAALALALLLLLLLLLVVPSANVNVNAKVDTKTSRSKPSITALTVSLVPKLARIETASGKCMASCVCEYTLAFLSFSRSRMALVVNPRRSAASREVCCLRAWEARSCESLWLLLLLVVVDDVDKDEMVVLFLCLCCPGKSTVHCRSIVALFFLFVVVVLVLVLLPLVLVLLVLDKSSFCIRCSLRFNSSRSCSVLDFQLAGAPKLVPTDADWPSNRFPL